MNTLDDAVVVVVGASSGLGLATARAATGAGAQVVMVARDVERLERARDRVAGDTVAHALDAADESAVERLFAGLDRVDHVVSYAGQQTFGSVAETTHDEFRASMDARVWSARNLTAAAAPRLPALGSLTFTSGTTAHRPRANRSGGAAATAALENFAVAVALELAPIRVNVLCPGVIHTPMLERVLADQQDDVLEQLADEIPVGHVGRPEEVADAALFLMRNTYVTGGVLRVDGGFTIR